MKRLLIGLLALGSISAFAIEPVSINTCRSVIKEEVFNSAVTNQYIVKQTGVRCLPFQGQCQRPQVNHDANIRNRTILDQVINLLPGEAKIFEGKLITCAQGGIY